MEMQDFTTELNTRENSRYTTETMVGRYTKCRTTIMVENRPLSSRLLSKAPKSNEIIDNVEKYFCFVSSNFKNNLVYLFVS